MDFVHVFQVIKMSKRKKDQQKQSEYWKEFESVENDEQAKRCKRYQTIVRISNNSTTNLIKHLYKRHNHDMDVSLSIIRS